MKNLKTFAEYKILENTNNDCKFEIMIKRGDFLWEKRYEIPEKLIEMGNKHNLIVNTTRTKDSNFNYTIKVNANGPNEKINALITDIQYMYGRKIINFTD